MAAYAALTSLMGTVQVISHSCSHLQEGHKEHLELLYDKASSLRELILDDEPAKELQEKARELEDQVESQVRVLVMEKDEHVRAEANERILKILQQALEEVDPMNRALIKQRRNNNFLSRSNSHVLSSSLENDMVGYSREQQVMRGQLTGQSSQLEVIAITGMGGIGKSTFARKMFSDPSILSFFDVRGWITVSKDYSLRKMLLSLLRDVNGVEEGPPDNKVTDTELADRLQKSLKGRRYLIVVDDIWSIEAWDDIRLWFPEYSNKSRILLTTRDTKVAQYASSPRDPFTMRFLEPEESRSLFNHKAFGEETCPIEYEDVAKEVVRNCNGLPLMISVVAGILSSERTLDEWWKVAASLSSLVDLDDYQRCSRVLALSYNHLPSHLKACFLYFGVFPKAREIPVKKLIRLWVAEGLLVGLEELETLAANLLSDLIDKSLVAIGRRSLDDKIKTCRIHDLLHDLCLREAESNSLLYVVNPTTYQGPEKVFPQGRRWVSLQLIADYDPASPHRNNLLSFDDLTHTKTRSLQVPAYSPYPLDLGVYLFPFKLLRVLDLEAIVFYDFHSIVSNLVCLRYLVLRIYMLLGDLPIPNLPNLQTLVIRTLTQETDHIIDLPKEIWEMSQLRNVSFNRSMCLTSPPSGSAKYPVLEKLQSVSRLSPSCCSKEILEGIKVVKKLRVCGGQYEYVAEPKCLENLAYLHELEALSVAVVDGFRLKLPCPASFPPNLKKLTLSNTRLQWEDMTIISKLPKLELLQLKAFAFKSVDRSEERWQVTEPGFPKLRFLLLENLRIQYWGATEDDFPSLERVIIRHCPYLAEIPQGFTDSMTLQRIELHRCTLSLVTFAKQIQEDQESMGNYLLKMYAFATQEVDSDEESTEGDWSTVSDSDEVTEDTSEEEMEETARDSEED